MSLSRLALRLAAYEALNPFSSIAEGPWPTLAGNNIYDSRLDPIDEPEAIEALLTKIEGQPIVTLYTEEQEGEPYAGADYPVDKETVTLVAELMIAARGSVTVENADGTQQVFGAITPPITDREHELLLDVLEGQVRQCFDPRQLIGCAALFRSVVMEDHHVHSVPQRDVNKVTRIAARTVKFRLRVKTTIWPQVPVSPAPTGLELLPQPLFAVASALDEGSTGYAACLKVAALLRQPAPLTPLQGINIFVGMGSAPTQSDGSDSYVRAWVDTTIAPARLLNRFWKPFAALRRYIHWRL